MFKKTIIVQPRLYVYLNAIRDIICVVYRASQKQFRKKRGLFDFMKGIYNGCNRAK